ncbi:MAG: glycoside hydrolase 43 family protein [Chitinophagaceae bacterium]|nr:glycoside hydrolase 43 family protein [Chitinophagaceae bacterium]
MKKITTTFIFLFTVSLLSAQTISKVWVADNGNGTYKNPVINADYSDPDAIRVGDDYYMISSSFNHVPGLPILHSKDLVNWKLIGHALKRLVPEEHFSKVQHGAGVWAPSIRYHNNEFYIYYPDPDFGIYLIKTKNILGPWTEPLLVEAGKGLIDPCPLWDDNNKVYLVHAYAGSRAGIKSIIVVKELNAAGTKAITDAVMVYDGHENDPTIEGPKFYKRNGYYYIFAPAGGVSTGWQTILRSKNVYGPYERKVVMDQGTTSINGPHQGAWVNTKTGEDWFLHFQDKDAYGRVVHLQPMKWIKDWPVIGEDKDGNARPNGSSGRGKGEPVIIHKKPNVGKVYPITTPEESDEFNSPKLGLQWQWQANPKEGWVFPTASGSLRLFSVYQPDSINNIWNLPNILGQKLPAEEFIATVKLTFNPKFKNEQFGLIMFGSDYAYISIEKGDDGIYILCKENIGADKGNKEVDNAIFPAKGNESYLQIRMEKNGKYRFAFSDNNEKYTIIGKEFTAKPGRWVGAKLGMFCLRNNITNDAGFADVDWFRIEPLK